MFIQACADGPLALLNTEQTEWLQRLYTCPYVDRKNINPPRVEGTCEWFTSHPLFQNWQQRNAPSLLWVSADPGCGKSVLARYLVDEVLRSTDTRTTCYFFFKDGFEDQTSSTTALCCILRQIFQQRPDSFSDQILRKLEEDGKAEEGKKKPPTSFHDLWDLFIAAATGLKSGEIVCILDALDECQNSGRDQLIDAIVKFLGTTARTPAVRFLLTSRFYLDIAAGFQDLERKVPTIHLSGENEEQTNKITREIDMVIRSRIAGMHRLGEKERAVLEKELTRVPNRTYLWVHLIFDEIKKSYLLTQRKIRSEVRNIPQTIDEAYDRILSKSRDVGLAEKLLHIVVAAARPLTLQEMALALAIGPTHRSLGDLEPDMLSEEQFRLEIRELCGLFIVVVDSRIYLLHQTAREFLVHSPSPRPSASPSPSGTALRWKFSLHPGKSNRIVAESCMWRLSLSDFTLQSFRASPEKKKYIDTRTFLGYAAQFWADHCRNSDWENEDRVVKNALSYFNSELSASSAWFEIYQTLAPNNSPESFTPLVVASYFGLIAVVHQLLETGTDAKAKGDDGQTPLHWASISGYDTVVQRLLEAGADTNEKDNYGQTPLHWASISGYDTVVQRLLEAGADTNEKDNYGQTPLHWASMNSHDTVVQRLLEAGADTNEKDNYGQTPLHWASMNSHDTVVQRLLEAGADINVKDNYGRTPLYRASINGHDTVVQRLLEASADTNVKDNNGRTPLH
jgi:ankyrin repeat protein